MTMSFVPQGFTAGMVRAGKQRNGGNMFGLFEGPQMCKFIIASWPQPGQESHLRMLT